MSKLFIHHRREKLCNAIIYFSRNTKHLSSLKLFKLLNFLDFEHYRQTGRSVTGLNYHAFPKGPVPPQLYVWCTETPAKNIAKLASKETSDEDGKNLPDYAALVKQKLDESYFTLRELDIMKKLVIMFGHAKAQVVIDHSHQADLPWKKVYGVGEGKERLIPYELALSSPPLLENVPTINEEERVILQEAFAGMGFR